MTDQAITIINEALSESARVKTALREQAPVIVRMAERMVECFRGGGRLYACGNGGSACDAMHLVEELVARYKRDRPGLPAHHLLDAATLTCWSNDHEFATAFSRQVEAMARPGDVLVAISTSGRSRNVLLALDAANARGAVTLGLSGGDGGEMPASCAELLIAPSRATERIQEAHIAVIHLLCELVELTLFPESSPDLTAIMPRHRRTAPILSLLLLLMPVAACERAAEPVPPEIARVRQQSARGACVATELLRRASDDVASLGETLASTSEGPAAEVTRRAGTAALSFARAYQQHAQLRAARFAQLDSAYNHSRRAADSVQHAEAAQRLAIRAPEPATIEANVLSAWEQDFASLFGDPDHPCNWDLDDK